MKKPVAKRDYNFSDADLAQRCDDASSSVTRDQTEFTDRDFTEEDNEAFLQQSKDFNDIPTDEELEAAIGEVTETKDNAAENLRVSVRTIRAAAKNKWGEGKPKYRAYGFEGMDELNEADLVRLGRRVGRVATAQVAVIGSGIDAAKIAAHTALVVALDDAIDAKGDAEKNRDVATQERILAGNALYDVLVKVCTTGKDIWESVDEAKYNDYVIYDTPSGGPEAPPPTP